MRYRLRLLVLTLCAAWLATGSGVFAGTTGKIAGTVIDKNTGEPLPGANVRLEGTPLGAATNVNGEYIILNIPPGTYALRASFIGYGDAIVQNVQVSIDVTTTVNIQLAETVLELGETVEVIARRPMVQKDLTATTAIVDAKNIANLPVAELNEVVTLQAGVVEQNGLHIRGGRAGEVAYWIDGVPVTDGYDGSAMVDVNKDIVQELQVISGAFNAEYGQALSGIVNIATKEGSNKFSGSISGYAGDYLSTHNSFNWGPFPDGTPAPDVPMFRGIDDVNPLDIGNIEGGISGPLIKDHLFFYFNVRQIYFDGWLRGQRTYLPQNIGFTDSTGKFIPSRDSTGLGDNEIVPMNWNRRKFFQGKLIWRLRPTMKLANTIIYDNVAFKDFDRNFVLNPDGDLKRFREGLTNILKLTHTLSSRAFYDLALSYSEKLFKQYVYEDPHDPRYVHPQLLTQQQFSFKTGGVNMQRFNRRTSTLLAKLDLTAQVTNVHQFKTGIELRRNRVFFEDIQLQPVLEQSDIDLAKDDPYIRTRIPDLSEIGHDRYSHNPTQFSAYVQDKIELADFIVNIGLRIDRFNPDGVVLADPTDPNIYEPIRPENRFHDLNGNGIQDPDEPDKTVEERAEYWYNDATPKTQFSPRLGVSFPVTAGGVFHFSFGYFFQIPRFDLLYLNSDFKIGSGTGNQGLIGNADLKPEQTINAEVGLKQQLTDDSSMEMTIYIRDIRNLTSTAADAITVFGGAAEYNKFVNADFGFVRGIVVSYQKRFMRGFTASADYTFQIAKASNSDPQAARNALNAGSLPEIQLTPVPWDQKHTLNVSTAYSASSWGGGLILRWATGQPYTPRLDQDISTLAINSGRKPNFFTVDLRLYKDFQITKGLRTSLFARVFNLFDIMNQVNVFDDTGRGDFTTDRTRTYATFGPATPVNLIDEWYTVPTNFSEPRRLELGATLFF